MLMKRITCFLIISSTREGTAPSDWKYKDIKHLGFVSPDISKSEFKFWSLDLGFKV